MSRSKSAARYRPGDLVTIATDPRQHVWEIHEPSPYSDQVVIKRPGRPPNPYTVWHLPANRIRPHKERPDQ